MATCVNNVEMRTYAVIHPLDDVAEEKCSVGAGGRIAMTRSVKISLALLRGYMALMAGMLAYHVLDLAGLIHRGIR